MRHRLVRHFFGLLLALVLTPPPVAAFEHDRQDPPCQTRLFENSTFLVCQVDTRDARLQIFLNDEKGTPLRSFTRLADALGRRRDRVRFAMNAGMFEQDGEPSGLLVQSSNQLHPINLSDGDGNFYLKPNGVFWMDASGALHINGSEEFSRSRPHPVWATQSGPLLLETGAMHARISFDGTSLYIRNGVGLRDDRHAIFVISDDPVSFGRLARFFRDALGCKDALYLDGAISSIWVPSTGRRDHDHLLGPLIAVFDRAN